MVKICFSTSDDLVAKVIKWFTKSKYNHCFLAWDDARLGGVFVMEANWDGFHIRPYSAVQARSSAVIGVILEDKYANVLPVSAKWLGKKYDYPGFFGMAAQIAGRWVRLKLKNPTARPEALFCSEAVALALQEVGYPGADKLDPSSTTPQDLMDFLLV